MSQAAKIDPPEQAPSDPLAMARRLFAAAYAGLPQAPIDKADPFVRVLDDAARQAREAGLTDEDIAAELAAYNAERRD